MKNSTFLKQIEGTQFEADLDSVFSLNGADASRAWYNLIVSIRDVKIATTGMKISRHWRLKHVKAYFGVTGSTAKVLEQLEGYQACYNSLLAEQQAAQQN